METPEWRWRIRIFNHQGSCVEGGFATQEDAAARQAALNRVYAAHPEHCVTTVLEVYTPTRPVYERVQTLLARVRAEVGETDPLLRLTQGLPNDSPLLAIYEGLVDSLRHLAKVVYDEEGRY